MTSHVFRKTVASIMDDASLSARAAADQLGHAKVSMTQDNYFKRKVRKTGAATVLESIAAPLGHDANSPAGPVVQPHQREVLAELSRDESEGKAWEPETR